MVAGRSRILVVDDDHDILDLLAYNLEKEGFKVKKVDNSLRALKAARKFEPDLIILDIMMPELDGLSLCEQLRGIPSFQATYIFFLTAKSGNTSRAAALNSGGDEYIEKLMGLRSLICKVKSVLKRGLTIRKRFSQIETDDIVLRRADQTVTFKGKTISLTADEFELLYFFVQNKGRIISNDHIIQGISSEGFRFSSAIQTTVNSLRTKIASDIIRSTNGGAYCLEKY